MGHYEYSENSPYVRLDLIPNIVRLPADSVPTMDQVPDIDDVPAVTIMPTDEDEQDLIDDDKNKVDGDDFDEPS